MENERFYLEKLAAKFPAINVETAAVKPMKLYVELPLQSLLDAARFLHDELGFDHLCTITGLDNGEQYEFLYHIAHENGYLVTLKVKSARDGASIPSVLPVYEGAVFYEREIEGLLGVHVEGLPEGRPYPLPDNWPEGEYPLRKDWKPKAQREAEGGQENG
ncbi:MAG: NADH-quinone oxidoreductase subunit C [Clostridiaceae bacterium]|nr:NADH-quinone oxidoreductase subunit C [Eubacteriales bacterium]